MDEQIKMTPAAKKILDAASHLFYWRGIHAVGVETIAHEAGVTKKTLYDRFGSKDQLIVAYLEQRDAEWKNHLHQYLQEVSEHQPLDKIFRIFDALENWLETKNQRGCAFINALAELPEKSHPGRNVILEEKKWLKELFLKYVKQLGVENVEQISETLLVLHEGIMVSYSIGLAPDISSIKKTIDSIIKDNMKQTR